MDFSARGRCGLDRVNIVRGVNTQDRRAVKSWRIRPDQRREALVFEGLRDRADTVWTFRMTRPGIVIEIRRVAQEKRGHFDKLAGRAARRPASWGLPVRGPLPRWPDFAD